MQCNSPKDVEEDSVTCLTVEVSDEYVNTTNTPYYETSSGNGCDSPGCSRTEKCVIIPVVVPYDLISTYQKQGNYVTYYIYCVAIVIKNE